MGAYGWAGEGRPSMPRDVGTSAQGRTIMLRITPACQRQSLHANNKTDMLIYSAEIYIYM